MNQIMNILDVKATDTLRAVSPHLEPVRLGRTPQPLWLITPLMTPAQMHWNDAQEARGYAPCNGKGCVLCLAGRTAQKHFLLPVLTAGTSAMGVLAVSESSRPGALLPQLKAVLEKDKDGLPVVVLVAKPDRFTAQLTRAADNTGVDVRKAEAGVFLEEWQAGKHDLTSAFPHLDNKALLQDPEIALTLKLRGIDPATLAA
jgi:hypothetical protein